MKYDTFYLIINYYSIFKIELYTLLKYLSWLKGHDIMTKRDMFVMTEREIMFVMILVMIKGTWCLSWQKGHDACHDKGTWFLSWQKGYDACHDKKGMILVMTKGAWFLSWQKGHDSCHDKMDMIIAMTIKYDIHHGKRKCVSWQRAMTFVVVNGPSCSLLQKRPNVCPCKEDLRFISAKQSWDLLHE